jgi:hypothetical protein
MEAGIIGWLSVVHALALKSSEETVMKKLLALASTLTFVLAVNPAARAGDAKTAVKPSSSPESVVYDAASAFDFLKTLAGTWERSGSGHEHGGKSKLNTFRVSSGGSSVIETIFPGEADEMITVYHMNGPDLLLTHYCALQNAPVMKFVKSDTPGEIKFVFAGGTNFDPKTDMHVHEGTYRVKSVNAIEADFVVFNDGKVDSKVKSLLKRKQMK